MKINDFYINPRRSVISSASSTKIKNCLFSNSYSYVLFIGKTCGTNISFCL